MELCERGSLERALKLGKLKKADGRPDFVRVTGAGLRAQWVVCHSVGL